MSNIKYHVAEIGPGGLLLFRCRDESDGLIFYHHLNDHPLMMSFDDPNKAFKYRGLNGFIVVSIDGKF